MWELLEAIESSSLPTALRESLMAYPTILALHAIGMAFLVGLSAMISLRILGFAGAIPLAPMERLFGLIYLSFWVNAISGAMLTSLALVSFLSNPVFYIKIASIVGAVFTIRLTRNAVFASGTAVREPLPARCRTLAIASMVFWGIAIVAGRLTAYSFYVSWRSLIAIVVALVLVFTARLAAARLLFPAPAIKETANRTAAVAE